MRVSIETTEEDSGLYAPSVRIEVRGDELDVFELVETLIKPAIMAMGYAQSCVEDAFAANSGECCDESKTEKEPEE